MYVPFGGTVEALTLGGTASTRTPAVDANETAVAASFPAGSLIAPPFSVIDESTTMPLVSRFPETTLYRKVSVAVPETYAACTAPLSSVTPTYGAPVTLTGSL